MKHPLKIVFILYFVSLSIVLSQNINDSTKTTGFDYVEIKYPEGRIELFGVKFKDPLVLCQILIGLIMAITFIQSGFDKIINREENFWPARIPERSLIVVPEFPHSISDLGSVKFSPFP